jgi:hypothetical protein
MTLHVVPNRDLHEHDSSGGPCPCMPRAVEGVIVHNSFDGREAGTAIRDALDSIWAELDWARRAEIEDKYRHARLISLLHFPTEDGDRRARGRGGDQRG